MDTPNPELMHAYGTDAYYLEKVGAFKDVLRLAAPAAWLGMLANNHADEERHRAEAEAMNMALRAAEAERMRPTLMGFYGHHAPERSAQDYSDVDDAIQAAQELGKISHVRTFAYSPASLAANYHQVMQEKAAVEAAAAEAAHARAAEAERMRPILAGFGKTASLRGKPAITTLAENLGRSLAHQELTKRASLELSKLAVGGMEHQFLQAGAQPPRPAAPAPAPIWAQPHHQGLPGTQTPGTYRTAAPRALPTPPAIPATPGPVSSIKDPRFKAAPGNIAGEGLSEFKTSPWQKPGQKLLNDPTHMAGKTFTPTPGAPRVPTTGLRTPKVPGASKPWISTGTKLKGLGVLGIGAAAYGGYKLINKVKQKADEPHMGGHAWGQAAPSTYTGVGEYGHPVY